MDDWQVGDLALCVRAGEIETPHCIWLGMGLVNGRVYEVTAVGIDPDPLDAGVILFLKDDTIYGDGGRAVERFIKITPPEADAFDREVIEQMTGNPAKVRV